MTQKKGWKYFQLTDRLVRIIRNYIYEDEVVGGMDRWDRWASE